MLLMPETQCSVPFPCHWCLQTNFEKMERFTEVLVFESNDEDNGVTPDMTDASYRRRPATASSASRWSRLKGDPRMSQPGDEVRFSNGAWDGLLHKFFGGQQDLRASGPRPRMMSGLGSETGYDRAEEDYEYENAGIELNNGKASKVSLQIIHDGINGH